MVCESSSGKFDLTWGLLDGSTRIGERAGLLFK